jgi:Tol biopolymer transport system component
MAAAIRRIRRLAAACAVAPLAVLALAAGGDGGPELVSAAFDGGGADQHSFEASVSNSGKVVAFRSFAGNLTAEPLSGSDRIYVRDRAAGTTTLASSVEGVPFGGAFNPILAPGGRHLLFQTYAAVLVPPDAGTWSDLLLLDRKTGALRIVSLNGAGEPGNHHSFLNGASLTSNGRFGVLYSTATNLTGDAVTGTTQQIFLMDFRKGTATLVSKAPDGAPANGHCDRPSISPNGRWIVFDSIATNLVAEPGSARQVYLYDVKRGTLRLGSVAADGGPGNAPSFGAVAANNGVTAFCSGAGNLLADPDGNGGDDVFLFDPRRGGSMRRISVDGSGAAVGGSASKCCLSQTGGMVAFATTQPLVPEDGNGARDVYSFDVKTGTLRLVSRNAAGEAGNGQSDVHPHSMAANGKWLAFVSQATDLVDGDGNGALQDVFVADPRR